MPRRAAARLLSRGAIVAEGKCRFQATLVRLSINDGQDAVTAGLQLVREPKKVKKATHPHIHAFQIGTQIRGHDDDGERGAGARLHRALDTVMDGNEFPPGEGVLVSVTRWYGGSHLGARRFRVIERAAFELLKENRAELIADLGGPSSTTTTRRRSGW